MAKHETWEVWKANDGWWKVQFPKGIMSYRLKRDAEAVAEACKNLEDNDK